MQVKLVLERGRCPPPHGGAQPRAKDNRESDAAQSSLAPVAARVTAAGMLKATGGGERFPEGWVRQQGI